MIARPGPYINAELDAGGYPGWLTTEAGRARTDAPDYLAAADEWLSQIDAVMSRNTICARSAGAPELPTTGSAANGIAIRSPITGA